MNKKDLIAQISQNLAVAPAAPPTVEPVAPEAPSPIPTDPPKPPRERTKKLAPAQISDTEKGATTGTGKQAAFWLDDEDRALFHEMGMLLYSQGIKPSHNLVLRAALRMVPRDHRLVEKVRELMEKDGRKLRHQKQG